MTNAQLPVVGELTIGGEIVETYERDSSAIVKIYVKSGYLEVPIAKECEIHLGDRIQMESSVSFSHMKIEFEDFPKGITKNNHRR